MSATINGQLVESLAQAILSLSPKERVLVLQRVQTSDISEPRVTFSEATQAEIDCVFQSLDSLELDPNQPSLAEIAQEVRQVRRELRTQS